jgi:hypothetical protein
VGECISGKHEEIGRKKQTFCIGLPPALRQHFLRHLAGYGWRAKSNFTRADDKFDISAII